MGNTLFDIKKLVACSAMLIDPSRSTTAAPMLGRNLDYPSRGYAQEYGLVTIYRPAGKRAFVSVGFPGLLGCLSGMNASGLALAVLEVFQARLFTRRLDLRGTPYAICFRTLLEECDTVEQALARLRECAERRCTTWPSPITSVWPSLREPRAGCANVAPNPGQSSAPITSVCGRIGQDSR